MELLYGWLDENEESLLSWNVPVVMSGIYLSGIFMLKSWKERQKTPKPSKVQKGQEEAITQLSSSSSGTASTSSAATTQQQVNKPKLSLRNDPLRVCMAAHNLFLFLLSLAMVLFTIYEAFVVRLPEVGVDGLVCSMDRQIYSKGLLFWSAVFYFSKVFSSDLIQIFTQSRLLKCLPYFSGIFPLVVL